MDEERLRRLDWALDCLTSRCDAVEAAARADAVSGTKVLRMSRELDLGRDGWGEVEYDVTATYKAEFTLKTLRGVDWNEGAGPRPAIEAAIRKVIARSERELMTALAEKL